MSKYSWYIKRIKCMSPLEIVYRINWKLRQDLYYRFKANKPTKKFLNTDNAHQEFKNSSNFWFQKTKDINKTYLKNLSKKHKKELIKRADKALNHIFNVYEIKNFKQKNINWHLNLKTKKSFPKKYQGDIYFFSNQYGGVLYVWMYNRFLHFYDLGTAYLLTKNEKYAKEIINQLNSWIEQNPYLIGINWSSPLEMAIRSISWIWALNLIKDSENLDQDTFNKTMQYIYLQIDYISKNLSKYSSANNHLVGEATAMVFASSLLPFLKNSEKYKKAGFKILEKEATKQILEDGVGAEQATAYSAFLIDMYIQSYLITNNNLPEKIKQRIHKALSFINDLTNNKTQLIGESGEGIFTGFNSFNENFESLLAFGTIFFKDKNIKPKSNYDNKVFWLLGQDSKNQYNKIKSNQANNSTIYPKGGYAILKNNKAKTIFDFGPLGYLRLAAHGHADLLNIILEVNNEEFLVDSCSYQAHSGGIWRDYFKSTKAHNTAIVDNKNQAQSWGNSLWDSNPKAKLINHVFTKKQDKILVQHNAYKDVIHKRGIINNKQTNKITIIDYFKTNKLHKYTLFFHLHPDVKIKKITNNEFELKNKSKSIKIIFKDHPGITIIKGQENPILGWYSPSFGVKQKTNTICVHFSRNKNTTEIQI